MHSAIRLVSEGRRGCGYRKPGGLYLIAEGEAQGCGKLPVSLAALNRCPHCGQPLPEDYGVRPSRAPRILANPELLWRDISCKVGGAHCLNCPLSAGYETGPALLLWIGESFYPTYQDFIDESKRMGISRRISVVPKEFEVGRTWVLLAHPKVIRRNMTTRSSQLPFMPDQLVFDPGVFGVFRPTRIEVVVTGDESDEEIEAMLKRGLSPVKVENLDRTAETETENIWDDEQ